jgi:hypothetical protein
LVSDTNWRSSPRPAACCRPDRAIQLGLSGVAVAGYVDEWTAGITDVTGLAHEIHALVAARDLDAATRLLPAERPYPLGVPQAAAGH